jgi:hypothetical protein
MSHHHHFVTAEDVKTFTLAGNATVTLQSDVTGDHYTFKVEQALNNNGDRRPEWYVKLLTGPDNWANYTYMGMVNHNTATGEFSFRLTSKSKYSVDAKPVRGFAFFLHHINAGRMPPQMTIRHEGKCGRCGRKLTVPESIDRGIGPDCAAMMGM